MELEYRYLKKLFQGSPNIESELRKVDLDMRVGSKGYAWNLYGKIIWVRDFFLFSFLYSWITRQRKSSLLLIILNGDMKLVQKHLE